MTVIAHHICFWVAVCWALSKLHCWGLEGLPADPRCISREKTRSWLTLFGMFSSVACPLQLRKGADGGGWQRGRRFVPCPQTGPLASCSEDIAGQLASKSPSQPQFPGLYNKEVEVGDLHGLFSVCTIRVRERISRDNVFKEKPERADPLLSVP